MFRPSGAPEYHSQVWALNLQDQDEAPQREVVSVMTQHLAEIKRMVKIKRFSSGQEARLPKYWTWRRRLCAVTLAKRKSLAPHLRRITWFLFLLNLCQVPVVTMHYVHPLLFPTLGGHFTSRSRDGKGCPDPSFFLSFSRNVKCYGSARGI